MIASAFGGAALGAALIFGLVVQTGDAPPRLYGMQEYTSLDLNMDRTLTYEEWLGPDGSAREIFANPHAGGAQTVTRYGQLAGVLIAFGLDVVRFSERPDTVSESCWNAFNAYYADQQSHAFDHLDQNADGRVAAVEFSAEQEARLRVQFIREDKDANGVIEPQDGSLPSRNIPETLLNNAWPSFRFSPDRLREACVAEQRQAAYPQRTVFNIEQGEVQGSSHRVWIGQYADFDRNGAVSFEEYLAAFGR